MRQAKKYTVLAVPRSGLFYSGGDFLDGRQCRVPWSRIIPIFRSHSAAVVVRDKMRKKWPDWDGDFVVLSVELKEKDDSIGGEPELLE